MRRLITVAAATAADRIKNHCGHDVRPALKR